MTDRTAPAKEAEAVTKDPCRSCGGKRWINDTTYTRAGGDDVECGKCFGSGLGQDAIRKLVQSRRSSPVREGDGLSTPKTASHPSRAAFVVERYIGGTLNYYCAGARGRGNADDWAIDYEWAVKFADNDSAQMALFHLCNKEGRVAEHAMIAT